MICIYCLKHFSSRKSLNHHLLQNWCSKRLTHQTNHSSDGFCELSGYAGKSTDNSISSKSSSKSMAISSTYSESKKQGTLSDSSLSSSSLESSDSSVKSTKFSSDQSKFDTIASDSTANQHTLAHLFSDFESIGRVHEQQELFSLSDTSKSPTHSDENSVNSLTNLIVNAFDIESSSTSSEPLRHIQNDE